MKVITKTTTVNNMALSTTPNVRMPALFVGHGSPMNAIEETVYAAAWREAGVSIPRPKAILCISAHWENEGTFVTAMTEPKTIHDFYGFPDELYRVQYPAPGSKELAERVREMVASTAVRLDDGYSWGLDHGAWSVLRRMYPEADIPTVQLSLDRTQHPRFHYDLGAELTALRNEGVLIVGSGNIVHNLRLLQWDAREPYPWATEFDQMSAELILAGEHDRLVAYPALGEAVSFFAEGLPLGSISMRSVRIG